MQEIAGVIQGAILGGDKSLKFSHYHFDTRQIEEDHTLFFALKTDQNDGHRFVQQLQDMKKKNLAAVVSRDFDRSGIKLPLIQVEDTLKAAHSLAAYTRNKYPAVKYVGVTGSAGKTTTKEFIYQLLAAKNKAHRSYENWNNWIGMPFSLLTMAGDEYAAVFELAMSYPGIGEIDLLAGILKPDVVLLLNVFPTHLEFLKNLENVAIGKSEILNYLSSDSIAFVSGDNPLIRDRAAQKKGRIIYFGRDEQANDIILEEVVRDKNKTKIMIKFFGIETEFITNIVNRVHIENLFAAIIAVQHLGLKNFEIQDALQAIKPLDNRGAIKAHKGFTIIDETYNANPEAVKKTLDWVDKEYKNKKIAVLGDMLELGEQEELFHIDVGRFFSSLNFDVLITVGKRAAKIAEEAGNCGFSTQQIKCFANSKEAGVYLRKAAHQDSIILFKASRGIRLEEAIKEFTGEE